MFAKGLVSRNDAFKTHIYTANFNKLAAQEQYLDKLTKVLFNGSTTALVLKALEKQTSNEQELAEIKAVITDLENK
jgi:predicted transcriptional regulator